MLSCAMAFKPGSFVSAGLPDSLRNKWLHMDCHSSQTWPLRLSGFRVSFTWPLRLRDCIISRELEERLGQIYSW